MDTDRTGDSAGRRTLTKPWDRLSGPISGLAEPHPCESEFIRGFFCIVPAWGNTRTQFVPHWRGEVSRIKSILPHHSGNPPALRDIAAGCSQELSHPESLSPKALRNRSRPKSPSTNHPVNLPCLESVPGISRGTELELGSVPPNRLEGRSRARSALPTGQEKCLEQK